jgi:hypothetical protein
MTRLDLNDHVTNRDFMIQPACSRCDEYQLSITVNHAIRNAIVAAREKDHRSLPFLIVHLVRVFRFFVLASVRHIDLANFRAGTDSVDEASYVSKRI